MLDLHIRQLKTRIAQVREQRNALIAKHKKKRKPTWDDETPLWKLIPSNHESRFITLMNEWKKSTTQAINPYKTHHFSFNESYSLRPVYVALARFLSSKPLPLCVSRMEFYRYLSAHTNLGSVGNIKVGLCRARKSGYTYFYK